MRRFTKDLILTACASFTSVLVALALAHIDIDAHFALYAFSWNFIPIGAVLCGALAASGYYLGFRLLPHRATGLLWLNAVLTSIAVCFLVYYIDFSLAQANGTPLSRLLSFGKFMSLVIENRRQNINFVNLGRVGFFGYVLFAVQIAGFVFGGLIVVANIFRIPCCDQCDRILKNPRVTVRSSNSLLGLEEVFGHSRKALVEGRSADAVRLIQSPGAGPGSAAHHLSLTLWKCDRCPVEFYSMSIKPGGDHVGTARDYSPARGRYAIQAHSAGA